MAIIGTKIDEYSIKITKDLPTPAPQVNTYDRGFLEGQLLQIQSTQDKDNALRNAEKAEVNAILALCDTNNIVVREEPIEKERI